MIAMPTTARPRERREFRPEIQGLRAVAVLLVLGYHLAPERLTGGYVGVDVFFAISGFLITGQIVTEAARDGRLSLSGFWGRRIRRLLPTAVLVLAVSLLATWVVLPTTLWRDALRHIAASVLYVENWALARDAVDYLAGNAASTLVQHYWSLSVEEQFYLLWPPLVVAVLALGRLTRSTRSPRLGVAVVLAVVTLTSLSVSIAQTTTDPGVAYFSTFTRIWEFGAGGLLALVGPLVLPPAARYGLGWAGLLAIVGAAVLFDAATPFPGNAAALPVLGAVAVIAAGGAELRISAARLLAVRPAVFVGDISYAVYLWHWPLIVLGPFVLGAPLGAPAKAVVAVLTLGLAWLTTRFVENPVRRLAPLAQPVWRTFLAGAVAMALVVGGVAVGRADLDRRLDAAAGEVDVERTAEQVALDTLADVVAGSPMRGCVGPAALDPANGCSSVESELLVPPALVGAESFEELYPGCMVSQEDVEVPFCEVGETTAPTHTIAVVGDSHATHWLAAFDVLGRSLGWRVLAATKASCPFVAAERGLVDEPADHAALCRESNRYVAAALDALVAQGDVDAVFLSAFGSAYLWGDDLAHGLRVSTSPLRAEGIPVVVLRDVPRVRERASSPACLEAATDARACGLPRGEALVPDPYADAAATIGLPVIDLTADFCDSTWCHAVVGGVVVYVDYSHLSREYSALLAAPIYRALMQSGVTIPD
jgi:peptidoglycan/LPS O-acetylase OafA/YrhL